MIPAPPPAAAAQEVQPGIPAEHRAQAARAQEMVDRIEAGDHTGTALRDARALLEECLAAGNYRSAAFLSGRMYSQFPTQGTDRRFYAEILLARGERGHGEATLRDHLDGSKQDCEAYRLLVALLVDEGRFADAMEVLETHLKNHRDEAEPLYARASVAVFDMRDPVAARAEVARMRRAADGPDVRPGVAQWLKANAALVEEQASALEKGRTILRAASQRLDRVLWGTLLGFALALGAAGWCTRRRGA